MFLKRKPKLISEQAILIEKKVIASHDERAEFKNLFDMRKGMYNTATSKKTNHHVYFLIFMTKKGRRKYDVEPNVYSTIKINSLGMLTSNREVFVSFDYKKIATEEDVKHLNW